MVSEIKSLYVLWATTFFFQFPVILTLESYCKFVHSVFCSILGKAIWMVLLLPVYVLAQHEWFSVALLNNNRKLCLN